MKRILSGVFNLDVECDPEIQQLGVQALFKKTMVSFTQKQLQSGDFSAFGEHPLWWNNLNTVVDPVCFMAKLSQSTEEEATVAIQGTLSVVI